MDDRGAMMTVGAFFAVFAVGMLYLIASAGETALYQERLQDAADDAAFSAAVTHAESMNAVGDVQATMIVAQSVVAGYQLAVLGAKLCHTFQIIQTGIDADGNGVDDFCDDLLEQHRTNRNAALPRVNDALREATESVRAIVEQTPGIANAEAQRIVSARVGPIVRHAFVVPRPMGVVASGNRSLCALANLHAFRLTRITMGVDMTERLLGRGDPQVHRDDDGSSLPHCPQIDGVDAFVPSPPERPPGTEPFQVRVIVIGDTRVLRGMGAGARVPYRTAAVEGDVSRAGQSRGPDPERSVVTSQAEYYSFFEHAGLQADTPTHSIEEEAFRMDWRARLRRFRYPTGGTTEPELMDGAYREWVTSSVLPACEGHCGDVLQSLLGANDALH